jgi:hypothetical protein
MAQVQIAHKDGRVYEVSVADFHRAKVEGGKTYEELGFKIVANGDGSPYEAHTKAGAADEGAASKAAKGEE